MGLVCACVRVQLVFFWAVQHVTICVCVSACVLTAQTERESQTRASLWASRCFALTLPYLIKRDGSGPWGQTAVHTSTHTHTHTYMCTPSHAPPHQPQSHAYTHCTKLHTHMHTIASRVLVFWPVFARWPTEKVSGAEPCVSLSCIENDSRKQGSQAADQHTTLTQRGRWKKNSQVTPSGVCKMLKLVSLKIWCWPEWYLCIISSNSVLQQVQYITPVRLELFL